MCSRGYLCFKTRSSSSRYLHHQRASLLAPRKVRSKRRGGLFSFSARACLTPEQETFFHTNGYLVVEGFASHEECATLRARAGSIVDAFDPATVSIFSCNDQENKSDEYFLNSAEDVCCFFEEKAFDAEGNLQQEKSKSINKIGHAMHDFDPVFAPFSRSEKLGAVTKQLGFAKPTPVQSMYIFKQPRIGGEVVPHQDSTFLYTTPQTVMGAWFALEEATLENGCLWIQPGSHLSGITRRMLLTDERTITFQGHLPDFDSTTFIPVPVGEGALVLLHGAVWHMSYENTSPKSRHAYSVHYVDGEAEWDQGNWLQRSQDKPFQPLEV